MPNFSTHTNPAATNSRPNHSNHTELYPASALTLTRHTQAHTAHSNPAEPHPTSALTPAEPPPKHHAPIPRPTPHHIRPNLQESACA